jgi:hypothetical protein
MIVRLFGDAVLPTNFSGVKLYAKVITNDKVFGESAVIIQRLDVGLFKEASIGRNFRITYLQAQLS